MTDEALMVAVRDGDVTRLGLLFERYHRALFDFLSRVTGDRVAAEDLVQDVFVRILKYRATYRDGGSFETWVFRIARNARADYFRSRAAAGRLRGGAVEDVADDRPERRVQHERDVERVRRALMTLPADKRELIVLARYHGLKHEQIAGIFGTSVGSVKVRLHRALRELRTAFFQGADEESPWGVKTTRALRSISTGR